MFANFTEETCVGTGDTLALAGATLGRIPFSESFADGDLVAYSLEDSAGVIKIAGIGTYVLATDDITRNDTWNWNGTVVDENPSSNIALSAGTHTIRCDYEKTGIKRNTSIHDSNHWLLNGLLNSSTGSGSRAMKEANGQEMHVFRLMETVHVSDIRINCATSDASGLASMGLSRIVNGKSESTYLANDTIDITTTGAKTVSVNKLLQAGYYMIHLLADSATVTFTAGGQTFGNASVGWTPLAKQGNSNRDHPCDFIIKSGVINGVLTSDPSVGTSNIGQSTNERPFLFSMVRT